MRGSRQRGQFLDECIARTDARRSGGGGFLRLVLDQPNEEKFPFALYRPADIPAVAALHVEAAVGLARKGGAGFAMRRPAIHRRHRLDDLFDFVEYMRRDRQLVIDELVKESDLFGRSTIPSFFR